MRHWRNYGLSSDTLSPLPHSWDWVGSRTCVRSTSRRLTLLSSVGVLYVWSAEQIKRGAPNGIEGALGEVPYLHHQIRSINPLRCRIGASALLLVSSLPRVTKGPVPIILALTSAGAGAYYGKTLYNLRTHA